MYIYIYITYIHARLYVSNPIERMVDTIWMMITLRKQWRFI